MGKLWSIEELFAGRRHFDREVIILWVCWYLHYKLSFRDSVEMMAERRLELAHTTIMRWVWRYAPKFIKRWNRFGKPAGCSWRVDETYIKYQITRHRTGSSRDQVQSQTHARLQGF